MSADRLSEEDVARYWDGNAPSWAAQVREGKDIAREFLNNPRSEEEERREPLGIRYVRTSYAELGMFPDAGFDAVVSSMALMDGPRFDRAMAECFRVLRPGGTLSFSITHPCFITEAAKWLRNEDGVKIKWMIGDYFSRDHWIDRWRFTGAPPDAPEFSVPRFNRTLSEYLNMMIAPGFVLKGLEEPRPSEEYCRAHPSQRGWRDHAALFLYVRAEKPGRRANE